MSELLLVDNLSLYVHIPFCNSCCSYCAFYSEPRGAWQQYKEAYVDRLEREILFYADKLHKPFETIFFGGGNPGCLSFEQLERLLKASQLFGKSKECTIEMNPESFSPAFFPLFAQKLVSRLSMGIQSMDDTSLKNLGRNASRSDNLQGIAYAKQVHALYGTDLSFDLMTCIPGQTVEQALADIDDLVFLADPTHISLYCLTIEEGTELARKVDSNMVSLLTEDNQEKMLSACYLHLKKLGYRHYEISNFAKQGKRCLHNLRYWNLSSYLGLGSSAASTLVEEDQVKSLTQEQDLATFSSGEIFSGYAVEILTKVEYLEEYLLMALRTDEGIDKVQFSARFGYDFDKLFGKTVKTFEPFWYFDSPQSFFLSEQGMMFLDDIVLRLAMAVF
ncbi:putative oxygen-independent coproporphyrinogen III oxidase [Sphaerochaeta pleomorpha str. Grapes]|uniref:Heme chaperone HemW n=1 Tax=Sphaerochaeta pleomorpha (strain ATCC BAA-1885 / DSM 22778 / Grapes) TaxID=158190 RepID=G8QW11_SPHPG|nr:radical SAM family heme chaperone HemW [Sphaerochaeta pleomorpha]AEV28254.1 putative oxygen-independent coproporphyrinogen III oxidase [Sphaerochaeta pleomorpha str. Grapes]